MKSHHDGPMAIPLWVNGHAFLTVADSFFNVVDAQSGEAVRCVPLCGAAEADAAAAAARAAQPAWRALPAAGRQAHLQALAAALEEYAGHFAGLLAQETGAGESESHIEVASAVAVLRHPLPLLAAPGVLAVLADAARPLAALVELAAPALAAGSAVVMKPSPKAPSAAFALCELSARAGWPAGVLNLLQGDEAAIAGLCASTDVDQLAYAGEAALGEKIAALAAGRGKLVTLRAP